MNTLKNYLTNAEYKEITGITLSDGDFITKVKKAEEIIDAYVGYHEKFFKQEIAGKVQSATNTTLKLENNHLNSSYDDFYKYCVVEIVRGKGEGQKRFILSSDKESIGINAWDTDKTPDETSYYRIYQVGKFPRCQDVVFASNAQIYFKTIPENIKQGVAFQIQYMDKMGEDFINSNKTNLQSESIGDYSYSMNPNVDQLISPMAKQSLHGFVCRIGKIIA